MEALKVSRTENRFDYVAYDDIANEKQSYFKACVINLENAIESIGLSSNKVNAIQHLEECYMWIGKAIRDDQIQRNAETVLQEQRSNS